MIVHTHRGCAWVVATCMGLALVPHGSAHANPTALVMAKDPSGVSPTIAAEQRKPVQERARDLRVSGEPASAGRYLADEAARLKDPVLFVDAADAYKAAAEQDREISTAELAIEQAQIANDILLFLGDDRAASSWRPVADDQRGSLLSRVDALLRECTALIAEIEADDAAPPEPEATDERPERGLKPGMGLIIGGSGVLAIGVGGLAAGVAGLAVGGIAQSNVDDSTVYGDEFDEFDTKGRRGNLLAYIGFPVAALGIGAGTALIILGLKKKRQAGEPESAAASLRVAPSFGGAVISGRF